MDWERFQREKILKSRQNLSYDEIYDKFYSQSDITKNELNEAMKHLEDQMGFHLGRLRPDDNPYSEPLSLLKNSCFESTGELIGEGMLYILGRQMDKLPKEEDDYWMNRLNEFKTLDDCIRMIIEFKRKYPYGDYL